MTDAERVRVSIEDLAVPTATATAQLAGVDVDELLPLDATVDVAVEPVD